MSLYDISQYLITPEGFLSFLAGVIAIVLIMLTLLIITRSKLSHLEKKYMRLLNRAPEGNLEEIILSLHKKMEDTKEGLANIEKNVSVIDRRLETSLRGFSIVRYNAFQDTGSDLSFSIAFLDEKKNGVIISSLYGREETRTYAKPVNDGKSSYHLSKEEEQALNKSLGNLHYQVGGEKSGK